MNKTIDARIFFLLPSESDKERINLLVENEISESFILTNPSLVVNVIKLQDKSILFIDTETYPDKTKILSYCLHVIESCGDKLIRILIVNDVELKEKKHEKITFLTRKEADDNQRLTEIVNEMGLWGLRNYIRFGSHKSRIAVFRMWSVNHWRTGVIHDISVSGMSCSFDRYNDIEVSDRSTIIEIIIHEHIFKLNGNFLIRRTFKNNNMFVICFASRRGGTNLKKLNSIIFGLMRQQVLDKIEKLESL